MLKGAKGFWQRFISVSLMMIMILPSLWNIYAITLDKSYTFYMVPNAHIDTAWQWPFQHTADTIINDTYNRAINALRTNTNYKFSTSASKHYEYAKEYYPEYYEGVKELVASGQWDITGGQVVEPDLNLAGGEALVRQSLYGQHFFEQEFGKSAQPVTAFVPDVFGFSGQFPQIIKKSEMDYFVTSKLNWNDTNRNRDSDILWWRAIDGKSDVLSYILSQDYPSSWSTGNVQTAFDRNWQSGRETGVKTAMGFYGAGDHGGGPTTAQYSNPDTLNASSPATVKMASATQYFEETSANEDLSNVRVHEGEMYFEYHRGTYTSWSRVKKYNRQNEILAEAAEKAATLSSWIGAAPNNSKDQIELAWDKILVNQMHDVLPGSAAPYVYYVAFNNHELAKNLLTNVRDNALLGMAYRANTEVDGTPVFVYNPLSWAHSGEVTVQLTFDEPQEKETVYIFDGPHRLPATVVSRNEENTVFTVSFVAENVPAVGYKVFSARAGVLVPDEDLSAYQVDPENWIFENEYLKMTLNPATGNIRSLINKADNNREVFLTDGTTEGNELHVYYDTGGGSWPAWDLISSQLNIEPTYILNSAPIEMRITERTEEKVTVLVTREWEGSTISQYITMYGGIDRIDVRMEIDWQNYNHLLKVSFPVLADASQASYEIAYGALQRSTTRDTSYDRARFEQSGHKWMDVTDDSKAFGVSLLNDAKYGYDVLKKTSGDQTFVRARITALRSPMSAPLSAPEYTPTPHYIDSGYQEFNYSIYPHANSWEDAKTVNEAHELNYPMTAFQTEKYNGGLESSKSFLSSDKNNVIISAIKNAFDTPDDKNTFVLRLYESAGRDTDVTITLPQTVVSAREVNMLEHAYSGNKALTVNGNQISLNIEKYEILTLEVKLNPFDGTAVPVTSASADLSAYFNIDGVSGDDNRRDGDLDGDGNTVPVRNWPATLDYQGIQFNLAETVADGENNYVAANGQTIALPEGNYGKVYLVGVSAGEGDPSGDFTVSYTDETSVAENLSFANWYSDLSGWNRFMHADTKPYVYDTVAHVFTHYHDGVLDQMTCDNYLFVYAIDIDNAKTVKSITLPEAESIKLAAISVADSEIPGFASVYGSSMTYVEPPAAPTNVRAEVAANRVDVTVSWEPSTSENVLNYVIYGGTTADFAVNDDSYLGMVPAARSSYLYSPDTKATFYFKVVALDRNVASSAPSLPSAPVQAGLNNYCRTAQRVWAVFSQNQNELDIFACDGNYATKWCATGITTGNARGYLNVQLVQDSDAPIPVERFKIAHGGVAENLSYNTRNFNIDYSLDGTNWTTAVQARNNTESITTHTLDTPVYARYVRLNVLNGEQGSSNTARIYEFMALGDENVQVKPVARDAGITIEPLANDAVRFDAGYTFFSGNPSVTEGATRFEWALKQGEEYAPLSANSDAVILPNAFLSGAAAVRCVIYPVDSDGLEGDPVTAEFVYNVPGSNVLLNARLVSSSGAVNANETADKLVDGNMDSKWCQEGISAASPGTSVFDMGAVYSLESFKLYHSASNPNAQDYDRQTGINTRAYQIAYSLDGTTWSQAADATENMEAITEHVLAAPVMARYVRLTVTLPNSGLFITPQIDAQQALRIWEFEGYGDFVQFGEAGDGVYSTILVNGEEPEALADVAGKTVDATVTVKNLDGDEANDVLVIAALYDAEGRLYSAERMNVLAAAGASEMVSVLTDIPEDAAGMTYRLFLWDSATYAPLAAAAVIE